MEINSVLFVSISASPRTLVAYKRFSIILSQAMGMHPEPREMKGFPRVLFERAVRHYVLIKAISKA